MSQLVEDDVPKGWSPTLSQKLPKHNLEDYELYKPPNPQVVYSTYQAVDACNDLVFFYFSLTTIAAALDQVTYQYLRPQIAERLPHLLAQLSLVPLTRLKEVQEADFIPLFVQVLRMTWLTTSMKILISKPLPKFVWEIPSQHVKPQAHQLHPEGQAKALTYQVNSNERSSVFSTIELFKI